VGPRKEGKELQMACDLELEKSSRCYMAKTADALSGCADF
jgi:hypothetical protein